MNDADPYVVLGLLPTAEEAVIRAAYKALSQRYHPDRGGDSQEAHERMTAINAAYALLSDADRRRVYDSKRSASANLEREDSPDAAVWGGDIPVGSVQAWRLAGDYFPRIEPLRKQLNRISDRLSFAFVALLLERKEFSKADDLAIQMRREFLSRYVGTDPDLLQLAERVADCGARDLLLDINRSVCVLGSVKENAAVILKRYRDDPRLLTRVSAQRRSETLALLRRTRDPDIATMKRFFSTTDYQVREWRSGSGVAKFLGGQKWAVGKHDVTHEIFDSLEQMREWVVKNFEV
jgi:DnaJ-domain-containing protein 1